MLKPFRHQDLFKRIVFHSRAYRQLKTISSKDFNTVDEASLMLHLTDLVMRQALGGQSAAGCSLHSDPHGVHALTWTGVRCSIIHCVEAQKGFVVSSNDDKKATGIQLDLNKYPEVMHVLNTQALVAVENMAENSELHSVREAVKDINFSTH